MSGRTNTAALLIAFAFGASLVLAAGRAGLLPPRVVPTVLAPSEPTAQPTCPPCVKPPSAAVPEETLLRPTAGPTATRTVVCERGQGGPVLRSLRLGATGAPAWAVHCGAQIEVLALGDTEQQPPRRILHFNVRLPGPALAAVAAPITANDLTGDGMPDLLAAARFDDLTGVPRTGAVYLLTGDAYGGFAAPTLLGAHAAVALTVGRMLDTVATDLASVGVQDPRQHLPSDVWLVRGGPAPVRAGRAKVEGMATDLAAVDLDLDGREELVIAGGPNGAAVLSFDAKGAERARRKLASGAVAQVLTLDVSGDGNEDAVLVGDALRLAIAAAQSSEPTTLESGSRLLSVSTFDVNVDGKVDLVGLNGSEVTALVQAGPASFTRQRLCALPSQIPTPRALALASRRGGTELAVVALITGLDAASPWELLVATCAKNAEVSWPDSATPLAPAPLQLRYDLR